MDASSDVRPAKINPAGGSQIEVSCSFFSFKDVAVLSGVGAKNQRGADTTCKNKRLNMDSKELMICEGNGEHLRYAAHHQPRRNDHRDAQ